MLSINCKELQMRSSAMTRRFRAFSVVTLAGASVLVFHSAAFAQQAEPAAPAAKDAEAAKTQPAAETAPKAQPPQDLPPEYAPPPGYRHGPPQPPPPPPGYEPYYHDYYGPPGYPPPRYYRPRPYYQPAPPTRYYPEPLTYRPFFFGFGLGVGGVGIIFDNGSLNASRGPRDNAARAGLGYNLRFGFGVSPRWSIVLSGDGAQAYFKGASVSETAWTIGPQVFLTRQLYARAGIGAATYSEDASYCDSYGYCSDGTNTDSGMATTAAIGFEFMQHYHTALALEAVGTMGYFPNKDKVSTFGLNFVLNLF
jgi:hypothetical protein